MKIWQRIRQSLARPTGDPYIYWALFLLIFFNWLLLAGASVDQGGLNAPLVWRAVSAAGVGLIIFLAMSFSNYRVWAALVWPLIVVMLLSLVGVLFFGVIIQGTKGWLSLGFFTVQPVLLAEGVLTVIFATYLGHRAKTFLTARSWLGLGVLLAVVLFLILAQPDVGSTVLILALAGFFLVVLPKTKKQKIILTGLIVGVFIGVLVFAPLKNYQLSRLKVFTGEIYDPLGADYNVRQGLIAIGSGGLLGQGIGFGSQSTLRFLPSRQTDFIFAVAGEATGLVGTLSILFLYALIIGRLWYWSPKLEPYGHWLTYGTGVLLFIHVGINLGVVLQLLPVTGVPLPWLGSAGTFTVVACWLLGLCQSAIRNRPLFAEVE